jgi:adenylate cyclase
MVLRAFLWLTLAAVLVGGLIMWGRMHIRSLDNHTPSIESFDLSSKKASIAVLPFRNLSQDPEQAYFSDGITRDIITDLSKFGNLVVISSNTTFAFKDKPLSWQSVGKRLGVRYVTEGSVQKSENRVRINVELIEASNGTHVWAERYDRSYEDIFDLQTEIVQAIVAMLAVRISKSEQARAIRKEPQTLEAYDYLLRGQALYHDYTRNSNNLAGEMFAKAIELDPNYAAAYTGLGRVYYAKVSYGWSAFPDKALESAYQYGRKALELDSSDASAHALMCGVYVFQNQYERAIAEGQRAIDLNPNNATAYLELGWVLLWSGRVDEAIVALERSLRLDSTSPQNGWWHLGMAYYLKGRYPDAVKMLEAGLTKKPGFAGFYIGLAAANARMGRMQAAGRAVEDLRRLDPFFKVDSFGGGFRNAADRAAIVEGLRLAGLQ